MRLCKKKIIIIVLVVIFVSIGLYYLLDENAEFPFAKILGRGKHGTPESEIIKPNFLWTSVPMGTNKEITWSIRTTEYFTGASTTENITCYYCDGETAKTETLSVPIGTSCEEATGTNAPYYTSAPECRTKVNISCWYCDNGTPATRMLEVWSGTTCEQMGYYTNPPNCEPTGNSTIFWTEIRNKRELLFRQEVAMDYIGQMHTFTTYHIVTAKTTKLTVTCGHGDVIDDILTLTIQGEK